MYYLLLYDYVENILERRAPFRPEHMKLALEAHEKGELLMGGALADPPDRAVLLFRADTQAVVEAFVAKDPYVRHGLVTSWQIRPWTVVIGA